MKKIVRKVYMDYEKEEKWLNEMSSMGLLLTDYSWCRYVFEEGEPGAYTYRLEMLEHSANSEESKNYIKFLEDTGVEHVASYFRWIFLRKKSSGVGFNLFTDIKSKINHHKRIAFFLLPISVLNIVVGFSNLINYRTKLSYVNLFLGSLLMYQIIKHLKKVLLLKKDEIVFE